MTPDPGCYFRGLCTASLTPHGPAGRRHEAGHRTCSGGGLGAVIRIGGMA
jgi:hypothetical protein